mmetsp:Transcript_21565/g.38737  ORF Transcript_21565/g.38737 Transcript_21565/m.38737 type:complete len:442 (-) Transcript_21565:1194-2519(-)
MSIDIDDIPSTRALQKEWNDDHWSGVMNEIMNRLPRRSHGKDISLCAKEILPHFVSNLLASYPLEAGDVFWDCGSGIGNVVMQVAIQCKCFAWGVELQQVNHEIASQAWDNLRRRLQHDCTPFGHVSFEQGDMTKLHPKFIESWAHSPTRIMIYMNNYLFPQELNLKMIEMFRDILPKGAAVCCMKPLLPIGRSARTSSRYTSSFNLTEIPYAATDVEWGCAGTMYVYTKGDPILELSPAVPQVKRQRRTPPDPVSSVAQGPLMIPAAQELAHGANPTPSQPSPPTLSTADSGQETPPTPATSEAGGSFPTPNGQEPPVIPAVQDLMLGASLPPSQLGLSDFSAADTMRSQEHPLTPTTSEAGGNSPSPLSAALNMPMPATLPTFPNIPIHSHSRSLTKNHTLLTTAAQLQDVDVVGHVIYPRPLPAGQPLVAFLGEAMIG